MSAPTDDYAIASIAVISGCSFLAFANYIFSECSQGDAQNGMFLTLFLGLADLGTNIIFALMLIAAEGWTVLSIITVVFIGLPILINLATSIYLLKDLKKDDPEYMREHYLNVAFVTLLSGAHVPILSMPASRVFGIDHTTAHWTDASIMRLYNWGCVSLIFMNVPQVVLQIFVLARGTPDYNGTIVTICALVASGVMFLIFITQRVNLNGSLQFLAAVDVDKAPSNNLILGGFPVAPPPTSAPADGANTDGTNTEGDNTTANQPPSDEVPSALNV